MCRMKAPNGEPILLIEYCDNIPHAVYTTLSGFDFDMHIDDWLMFYSSCGGKNKGFDIGGYVSPERWKVWCRPDFGITYSFNQEVERLKKPIRLKNYYRTSINPFLVAEEVDQIVYCARCEGRLSEMCAEHQYWCDVNDTTKYKDNHEEVE